MIDQAAILKDAYVWRRYTNNFVIGNGQGITLFTDGKFGRGEHGKDVTFLEFPTKEQGELHLRKLREEKGQTMFTAFANLIVMAEKNQFYIGVPGGEKVRVDGTIHARIDGDLLYFPTQKQAEMYLEGLSEGLEFTNKFNDSTMPAAPYKGMWIGYYAHYGWFASNKVRGPDGYLGSDLVIFNECGNAWVKTAKEIKDRVDAWYIATVGSGVATPSERSVDPQPPYSNKYSHLSDSEFFNATSPSPNYFPCRQIDKFRLGHNPEYGYYVGTWERQSDGYHYIHRDGELKLYCGDTLAHYKTRDEAMAALDQYLRGLGETHLSSGGSKGADPLSETQSVGDPAVPSPVLQAPPAWFYDGDKIVSLKPLEALNKGAEKIKVGDRLKNATYGHVYCTVKEIGEQIIAQHDNSPSMFDLIPKCWVKGQPVKVESKQLTESIAMPYDRVCTPQSFSDLINSPWLKDYINNDLREYSASRNMDGSLDLRIHLGAAKIGPQVAHKSDIVLQAAIELAEMDEKDKIQQIVAPLKPQFRLNPTTLLVALTAGLVAHKMGVTPETIMGTVAGGGAVWIGAKKGFV